MGEQAAVASGEVTGREVEMREVDTGVVDGGDEAVDVVVGGDCGVERPPELDGAEAGVGCGLRAVEQGEVGEEDGAVDGEAGGVHAVDYGPAGSDDEVRDVLLVAPSPPGRCRQHTAVWKL